MMNVGYCFFCSVSLDENTVEGDFLDELAVVDGVVVQDCGTNGDKAIELNNLWNKPVGTREAVEEESCGL